MRRKELVSVIAIQLQLKNGIALLPVVGPERGCIEIDLSKYEHII